MPYVPVSQIARGTARIIAQHGETMVLKRASEAAAVTLKGKRVLLRAGLDNVPVSSAAQQSFSVRVGVAELAASSWANKAPARKDSLVIDGRERMVLDVRPLKDGDTPLLYILELAG